MSKLTAPNILSASRIFLMPLLFWLLLSGHHYWFLGTYIVVGLTDAVDGVLARRLGQVSHFGKELDSFADLIFYISSAYFIYRLMPVAIEENQTLLIVFFSLLGLSFVVSGILFRRPIMMHTFILKWNAVLVYLLVVATFILDPLYCIYFARAVIIIYLLGFIEELLIFFIYGNVDPDTVSIIHLVRENRGKAL